MKNRTLLIISGTIEFEPAVLAVMGYYIIEFITALGGK